MRKLALSLFASVALFSASAMAEEAVMGLRIDIEAPQGCFDRERLVFSLARQAINDEYPDIKIMESLDAYRYARNKKAQGHNIINLGTVVLEGLVDQHRGNPSFCYGTLALNHFNYSGIGEADGPTTVGHRMIFVAPPNSANNYIMESLLKLTAQLDLWFYPNN